MGAAIESLARTLTLFGLVLAFLLLVGKPVNAQSTSTVDYDIDDDRLIEISDLEQLDAVRYDLDGNGIPDNSDDHAHYARAFPNAVSSLGCPAGSCQGYELTRDLDFNDLASYASGSVDRGWSRGEGDEGWLPIGSHFNRYSSTLDGNGHTIANLFIVRTADYVGLFGGIESTGSLHRLGLVDVDVSGGTSVGSLAGGNDGTIVACYATGKVSGTDRVGGLLGGNGDFYGMVIGSHAAVSVSGNGAVGGLAGGNWNTIIGSHATGNVSGTNTVGGLAGWNSGPIGTSYATGNVSGNHTVGGLVGNNNNGGEIISTYATGNVLGGDGAVRVGGLVGESYRTIRGSYASGYVSGGTRVGGLVGANFSQGTIVSSYAIGPVSGHRDVGGLLGYNSDASVVIGSYSIGSVSGSYNVGGLVGGNERPRGISDSYWNTELSGQTHGVGNKFTSGADGKTTAELQTPTSYSGIYRNWNTDIDDADGDSYETTGTDDPWDFSTPDRYPSLRADLDGDGEATREEFGTQHILGPPPTAIELPTQHEVEEVPPATEPMSCTNGIVVENPQGNQGLVSDCRILLEGRNTLAGNAKLNWSTDIPIARWQGITVGGSPLRVVGLQLVGASLSGRIPPQLGNLSALRDLSFRVNSLTGGIPPELSGLSELRTMDLHGNSLGGSIPPELGDLTNLKHLDLNANDLIGTIPPELDKLSNLEWLELGQNNLSGSIPQEFAAFSRLQVLALGKNDLTGPIPRELAELSSLDSLFLASNHLTGSIPPELGRLSNLRWLYLGRNELTGQIPQDLANLSKLDGLDLSENRLTGEIPPWLSRLSHLDSLRLSENQLTGAIPAGLGDLSRLTLLYLHKNQLTGTIPPELGYLSRLGDFTLDHNKLSGPIPRELGNLVRLQTLGLSNNDITGAIPPDLGNLSDLQYLSLQDNRLTGSIPAEFAGLAELQYMSLNDNHLTGSIPAELTALWMLIRFDVSGNDLTGCVPWHLANKLILDITHDGLPKCSPPVAEGGMFSIDASRLLDGGKQNIVAVGDAVNGKVSLDGATIIYVHDGSESISDSFTFTATDGILSTIGTVTVVVTPVNDPPIAVGDTASVNEGDTLSVDVLGLLDNDTDAENHKLTLLAVSDAVNGRVSLNGATIIYEHDGSETTSDSFVYTVSDGAETDTAEVTISITPVNDPPIAYGDSGALEEGETLLIEASVLLENDTDAENDTLSITAVDDAVNGSVSLDGTSITYTHDGSETTTGSFAYTVSDGTYSDTTTAAFTVTPVNDPPIAAGDTGSVEEGETLSVQASELLENDTDPENDTLIITAVGDAANGRVFLDGTAIIYEHDGSETAAGSFAYTVSDGVLTDTAEVTITVTPVNDPPIAGADRGALEEGETLSMESSALLDNDTDAENDTLSITAVGDALNGMVSLDGTTITYTHDGSETTTGSFAYTVSDGVLTDTAEVNISVTPVNDPPIVGADMGAVNEGDTLSIEASVLLDNDTDAENDTLNITAVGDAVNGTVSLDGTTITYTHDGSETTAGTFAYTVSDGVLTDTAEVMIAVTPVNDPPIAVNDKGEVNEGDTLSIEASALLDNDTDAENDTLTITAVGDAVNGTASFDGTTITYTHDDSETTTGSFTYTVSDGMDTHTISVAIKVVPVDDDPVEADEKTAAGTETPEPETTTHLSPATPQILSPGTSVPPDDDGRMNAALIVLIIVLAVSIAGGGAVVVAKRRNRTDVGSEHTGTD